LQREEINITLKETTASSTHMMLVILTLIRDFYRLIPMYQLVAACRETGNTAARRPDDKLRHSGRKEGQAPKRDQLGRRRATRATPSHTSSQFADRNDDSFSLATTAGSERSSSLASTAWSA
jgi:hypothetical protein